MNRCIECLYYSMWDGVCMCPTSRHLWTTCFNGVECDDFEEDEDGNPGAEAEAD